MSVQNNKTSPAHSNNSLTAKLSWRKEKQRDAREKKVKRRKQKGFQKKEKTITLGEKGGKKAVILKTLAAVLENKLVATLVGRKE